MSDATTIRETGYFSEAREKLLAQLRHCLRNRITPRGKLLDGKQLLLYEWVLDRGRYFPVTKTYEQETHPYKDRFRTASLYALENREYTYCEGLCYLGKDIFHHAWCINPYNQVEECTLNIWDIPFKNIAYEGLPFPSDKLIMALKYAKGYGFFLPHYWETKE